MAAPSYHNKRKADCTPEEWQETLAYLRAWRAANKDKVAKHEAGRDPEKRLASRRASYAKSPDSIRRPGRNRKSSYSPEKWAERLEQQRQHRKSSETTRKAKQHRERLRNSDPHFRVAKNLRARLRKVLNGRQKVGSAVRDLGCTIEDFRTHIESQFRPGMTWQNWGESWHLDHVYPLSRADLTDLHQLKAVANWRNYQPLWLVENSSKHASVSPAAKERFEVLANFAEVI
jgi:hypothetical protein